MPPNSTNDLFQFLSELLTTHSDTFQALGLNLFRGFALILIVWFGVRSALSSVSGGPGFHFDHFAQLILTIAFGFAMITYYSQPLPAIGVSFHKLITDEGLVLANRLNNGLTDEIFTRLNSIYFSMEVPVITFDIIAILHYVLIIIMILLLEAAVFFVIAFGYIAAAIAVLLGPVFVPFFIVPKMEWLFWGWFKAFVQYSFYPVVANAYLFIFGNMVIHLADSHPPPYDGPTIALLFAPLMFLLIGFVYGVVRIPSLVGSLFSGSSGESVIPKIL
jgi:TrbL/VirB6 plasmid conjugal transfer protein